MSLLRKISFYFVIFLSIVVIVMTLLSLLYDINVWWIKTLDFPRLQLLIVGLILLLAFVGLNTQWSVGASLLVLGLIAAIGLQIYFIFPYTPLAEKEVRSANLEKINTEASVKLLIANVYMHNRQAENFLDIVNQSNSDLVLVMETNQWWINALQPLQSDYRYYKEYPANNTYGMALYSRYPLEEMQVKFLQNDSVPSFHTTVQLPNGRSFHFHGVHPVPPVLSKHPDNKGQKEIALIRVGQMVAQHSQPTIVAGDFNDVAWSNTSRLFQVDGELNDVRVGRGLYNSFDATSFFLRWPLDHIYVSDEFRLINLKRLGKFGSDHFPIYAELELTQS